MEKKWFPWTSYLGYLCLCVWCTITIFFRRKFKLELWLSFLGQVILSFICLGVIPASLLSALYDPIRGVHVGLATAYNILIWVYLYFAGVLAVWLLLRWRNAKLII